jgi:hypothetical protein
MNLCINFDKTKVLFFTKPQGGTVPDLKLTCQGKEIEQVNSFKYLGVIFDEHLSFHEHFNYVCKKVSSAIAVIDNLKRFINLRLFKSLLNSFVYSIIDYALPVWGKVPPSDLEFLQKKVDHLIASFFYPRVSKLYTKKYWAKRFRDRETAHSSSSSETEHLQLMREKNKINKSDLLEKCNVLSVPERKCFQLANFAYQTVKYGSAVPYISNFFSVSSTSQRNLLTVVTNRIKFPDSAVDCQSIKHWNSLPNGIRNFKDSNSVFKRNLSSHCRSQRRDIYLHN